MDILIINPADYRHNKISEHLGIASLVSYVKNKGFTADYLDLSIEPINNEEVVRKITEINPLMVGVSMLDGTKIRGLLLVKELRSAGFKGGIVVGGYFPTFNAEKILTDFPEINYVARGEGEETLYELLKYQSEPENNQIEKILGLSYRGNGRIYENAPRPLIKDLDILPPVERKYAKQILAGGEALRISATRGCWGNCTFCDIIGLYKTNGGKAWRRRTSANVIDEISDLIHIYKTNHFIFNDDQFLVKGSKARILVEEFASEIEKRNLNITFDLMCRADTVKPDIMKRLKSVGLVRVFLGLESFDEAQLKRYKKNISVRQNIKAVAILYKLKIDVIASVILADAYTTLSDLLRQFVALFYLRRRYFNSRRCQISTNKKLEVYPGSAVYKEYKEKGLLTRDHYLSGYDFQLKPLTAVRLALLTIEEKVTRLLFRPKDAINDILNILAMKRYNSHKVFNLR